MGMRVKIQSDSDVINLFKELALLTNGAKVTLASIVVDESQDEITIPMRRRSYERKRIFLFGEHYKLISSELIDSRLIVKNTVDYEIKDKLHLPEIELLFGVTIKNKRIYFCSVEEQSGITAFEMSIKVRSYDINLHDELT